METLKHKTAKADFAPVDLNVDPLTFVNEYLRYFVGVAMTLKEKECINASRALLKLGCYVEPFNERSWKKYIEYEEQYGYIYKAFLLSKTAFLFTQQEDFARSYLSNGEKCGVALGEMRGILSSAQNPDIFEKGVLVEIGKLTLKHQQIWKGLKVLYEICQWNEFRLPVCALIIFLAKYLENIGEREKALQILKRSFGRGMSKLEVYTTYLEMKIRDDEGTIRESVIKEVSEYVDCISSENRYRLYLEIAEILYLKGDPRYKQYIDLSYNTAKKFCAPGTGCNKTLRQIYYTVLRWKNASPPPAVPSDSNYFEANRYEYIRNGRLLSYEFTDWKYYLHYGLMKRCDILLEASKKWSYTGRLIAEWIHSMRDSRPPREVLKIWREKIDEVPKSGELWCEGGRIYA
jgi:tetratricopeptide (TPR) repeat protein